MPTPNQPPPDRDNLLARFVRAGDQAAFAALVNRHLGMVFGVARRKTGDRELSEEIAQNVFAALAAQAGRIESAEALPAWLHRAAVLEANKAIRGESRRRTRMKKLIEITSLDGEGNCWNEAAAELDDAVDALSASDRQVVFQRYFQGLSFSEIARISGRSEAASQKQASRAVKKLAGLLRDRGFAVPVTVLTSALATALVTTAPSGLAGTISTTAMAAAATPTAKLGFLQAMSLSKGTWFGAAATLLLAAAFTAGGYVSGRHVAIDQREPKSTAAQGGLPGRSSAAPNRAAGSREASMREVPVNRQERSVREIVLAAADHFSDRDNRDARALGIEEIAHLQEADIAEAMRAAGELDNPAMVRDLVLWTIVGRWAEFDGKAAAEYALANGHGHFRYSAWFNALTGWSKHDPVAAYEWYAESRSSGRAKLGASHDRACRRAILRGWAAVDPGAALAELASYGIDDRRQQRHTFDDLVEEEATRVPYLEALVEFPDPQYRRQLIAHAAGRWSQYEPAAAAAWVDTLEFENEAAAQEIIYSVAESWFESHPRETVDWVWSKTPEALQAEFLDRYVRGAWAENDPGAATAWLRAHGLE